ncbi:DEAD/DEAH box helicase [Candidatus Poribacteria bacterium]|nr:DEAD/DEAH box helicase [Candidatus Poribacteria bacterium]MYF55049.1 DEAD/DEAH box helicase [Candidatus Poribacteria bacterium]MYI94694.1 DEAD/DEAH box helicase [Candidatus Poribacteria bacterium]
MDTLKIDFDKGTLILQNVPKTIQPNLPDMLWDERTLTFRAPAYRYRHIVSQLRAHDIPYTDSARQFTIKEFTNKKKVTPYPYQTEAIDAWHANNRRGVISLPTGAGKTFIAILLIAETQRPTLVHVPTIDLMHQWSDVLKEHFGEAVGIFGGGEHELQDLTVTTYQSAVMHAPHYGNRFGFAIYDECHHLPGDQYQYAAISSIAPFRLGLSATPDRVDGKESRLYALVGECCYEAQVQELSGKTLSEYRVVTMAVDMEDIERIQYEEARRTYLSFLKQEKINMGTSSGWQRFLWKSSQSETGRAAFNAYLTQKRLSFASTAKKEWVWKLIQRHRGDRILIFTQDNDTAYQLGTRFFLPVLTHQTKQKERKAFLNGFRDGTYSILVTSKALNEGVDVPEANVAIIVSGSGSVREHVQRLGRILRKREGKQAILYELISKQTSEQFVNRRRRRHHAYQK